MIKLPFSQKEHLQIFPTSLAFDFALGRDPENIFYCQCDVENYTDQVLDFLYDRQESIRTEFRPVILVSTFVLRVYATFSLFFKISLTESILIFRE